MGPRDILAVARRRVLSSGVNSSEPSLGEIKRDLPFNSRNPNIKTSTRNILGQQSSKTSQGWADATIATARWPRWSKAQPRCERVEQPPFLRCRGCPIRISTITTNIRKLDCILFVYSIDFPSWSFQPIKLSSNNSNRYNRLPKCRNNLLQLKHQPQMPPPLRMLKSLPGMITKRSENRCVCSLRKRASILSTSLFYLEWYRGVIVLPLSRVTWDIFFMEEELDFGEAMLSLRIFVLYFLSNKFASSPLQSFYRTAIYR